LIDTLNFYNYLINKDINLFAGVPDSLLKNICTCITNNKEATNITTANEGNAVALAAGYHISTNKYGVVYMQNSGLGNCVNPLLSLTDEKVYSIPMLLLIGWRGEPGTKDEPQHIKQGELTIPLLETMEIEYLILDETYEKQIDYCIDYMKKKNKPIALIVKKDVFSSYKGSKAEPIYELTREESLDTIIDCLDDNDFIVSTTGKTSREIFELRENKNEGHANDFLTVGSMGHTSSIAYGMSLGTDKNIYCIDGDGSFLMHAGSFGVITENADKNFKYILINNGAHESVGGQPTVAFDINIEKILEGFGFKKIYSAKNKKEIEKALNEMKDELLSALVIYTKQGSRDDLGRPTVSPVQNKEAIMKKINS